MANKTYSNDPQASKYQQPRKASIYDKMKEFSDDPSNQRAATGAAIIIPTALMAVAAGFDDFKENRKLEKLKKAQKRSSFKNTNKIKGVSSVRIRKIR